MQQRLSYASTRVDIDQTDDAKRKMARSMETADPRVLNQLGALAPLLLLFSLRRTFYRYE